MTTCAICDFEGCNGSCPMVRCMTCCEPTLDFGGAGEPLECGKCLCARLGIDVQEWAREIRERVQIAMKDAREDEK